MQLNRNDKRYIYKKKMEERNNTIVWYCFSPSFFIYIVYRLCSFAFENVLKVLIEETVSMSPTDRNR